MVYGSVLQSMSRWPRGGFHIPYYNSFWEIHKGPDKSCKETSLPQLNPSFQIYFITEPLFRQYLSAFWGTAFYKELTLGNDGLRKQLLWKLVNSRIFSKNVLSLSLYSVEAKLGRTRLYMALSVPTLPFLTITVYGLMLAIQKERKICILIFMSLPTTSIPQERATAGHSGRWSLKFCQ